MRKKRGRAVAGVILILSVIVVAAAGYRLWGIRQSYLTGKEKSERLANLVRSKQPRDNVNGMPIDFAALHGINPDAVAWLRCPGTPIDYPVMKAADYNYYLRHLPDGTYNANGSLFIDYNCAPDFSDALTVIYGHNMKSQLMFGSLTKYKEQAYYDAHPRFDLYTESGQTYRVDLLYGCVIGAGEWRERAFMYEVNLDALLSYAAYNTTFQSGTKYRQGDPIVAMSTCSYEFDGARYVVIGALRPI